MHENVLCRYDRSVVIWNADTGAIMHNLTGHTGVAIVFPVDFHLLGLSLIVAVVWTAAQVGCVQGR